MEAPVDVFKERFDENEHHRFGDRSIKVGGCSGAAGRS
jgi:hypothetical protein